jgi:hypothetical protein
MRHCCTVCIVRGCLRQIDSRGHGNISRGNAPGGGGERRNCLETIPGSCRASGGRRHLGQALMPGGTKRRATLLSTRLSQCKLSQENTVELAGLEGTQPFRTVQSSMPVSAIGPWISTDPDSAVRVGAGPSTGHRRAPDWPSQARGWHRSISP